MSEKFKLTAAQQAAAIDRARQNIALLSGAGCGKTFVLARRLTELLMTDGAADPLSRFVALTFTDKAAIEMLQRVRKMLGDFAAAATTRDDRRRLLGWLQELPEARICTIHAFCAALLRGHAIEAGIDPNFALCADELVASQMVEEAADGALLAAIEAGDGGAAEAITLLPYARVAGDVRRLLDGRTGWNASDYADPAATLRRWEQLRAAQADAAWGELEDDAGFRGDLAGVMNEPCSDRADKLAVYRDEQCAIIARLLADPASRTAAQMAMLVARPGGIGATKAWGDKQRVGEVRDRVKALVARVAPLADYCEPLGALDEQAADLLATLTRLAGDAEKLYAAEKRRRGLLDFTDLLAETQRLLANSPTVRRSLGEQISQLLVDEAQDTDAFQVALLETLIFGAAGGESLPDGRLFLVGDAKQSIYRFRGAQVEVFRDLCRRIGPGRQENLDRSFRTHAAGVAFVNHLFSRLMGDDYEAISAHRGQTPPGESVEILLAQAGEDEPFDSAEEASAAQAAITAQRIAEMVAAGEQLVRDEDSHEWRPVRYGDVAILFSRMTDSLEYERQLARWGVPYYVVAGTGFFKQQEVFDVLDALRAIENPFDDIAAMGVLRSGMVGLDDNAMMRIAEALQPPYLPAMFELLGPGAGEEPTLAIGGLGGEQAATLGFAVDLLRRLHRRKDAMSIDRLIEQLLAETGYEATLAAQFQGVQLVGNVRRLVERARSAGESGATLSEFTVQMNELVLSESRYEQAAVAGEGQGVVRLMTIHKAKGLEFPVVFVPDLNTTRRGVSEAMIHRSDWGLTYKVNGDDGGEEEDDSPAGAATPVSYRLARRREDDDRQAEDVRLLYVAATRHEDHLVFVAADWRAKDGQFHRSRSYIRMLDDALGIARAADDGAGISYDDGRYIAAVKKVQPTAPPQRRRTASAGEKLLASAAGGDALARGVMALAGVPSAPSLLGPLSSDIGRVELATTALVDFEHCPMLYRWRYELRIPRSPRPPMPGATGPAAPAGALDAATLGTLYHRCMEHLDLASPQPAAALVRQAAAEMELGESTDLGPIAADLDVMLAEFLPHPLAGQLAGARQVFRELDFVMDLKAATLRGQIDLLYQDAGGAWRIVDYKSDRVGPLDAPARAARYELQMLIYAAAMAGHTGQPPADATLYFLRPGVAHVLTIDAGRLSAARQRAEGLAHRLISARRSGGFERMDQTQCGICPYGELCWRNGK